MLEQQRHGRREIYRDWRWVPLADSVGHAGNELAGGGRHGGRGLNTAWVFAAGELGRDLTLAVGGGGASAVSEGATPATTTTTLPTICLGGSHRTVAALFLARFAFTPHRTERGPLI